MYFQTVSLGKGCGTLAGPTEVPTPQLGTWDPPLLNYWDHYGRKSIQGEFEVILAEKKITIIYQASHGVTTPGTSEVQGHCCLM